MNAVILEVRLPADHLDDLAERIAQKMSAAPAALNRPLTLKEAARELNISYATLNRRIDAGLVRVVEGIGCHRVSRAEIRRLLGEDENFPPRVTGGDLQCLPVMGDQNRRGAESRSSTNKHNTP